MFSSTKHLTPGQVEAFVQKSRRTADSLISAFEENHDTNYLNEAARNFPNNTLVQLSLLTKDLTTTNYLTTEERQSWLDRYKASSPQNAFPNYLAAIADLRDGQTDAALVELATAVQKSGADPLYRDRIQNREEMYILSGFTPVEARESALRDLEIPLEAKVKGISRQLSDLQKNYADSGNIAAAEQMAALTTSLARQWQKQGAASLLITDLVGIAMERLTLAGLDQNKYYDFLGQTAGQRTQELKDERAQFKPLLGELTSLYAQLNDNDKIAFLDRHKYYGEINAMKWLHERYGHTP